MIFCEYCNRSFSHKQTRLRHIKIIHLGKGNSEECDICEKSFTLKRDLNRHKNCVHREKSIKCEFKGCEKMFTLPSQMRIHYKQTHLNFKAKSYECDICSAKYLSKLTLVDHMRSKHLNQKYDCNQCHSTFTMRHSLLRHIQNIHHDFFCEFCDRKLNSKYSLDIHLKFDHMGFSKFECATCKKKFSSKLRLKEHTKSVHEKKKFACEFKGCDKIFTKLSNRKRHFDQVHLKIKMEKRFQCDLCAFKEVQKSKLIEHIESRHLGKKHNCNKCDAVFNARSTLYKHIQSKHKIISCRICSETFKNLYTLKRHKKLIHSSLFVRSSIKRANMTFKMFQTINFDEISNLKLKKISIILKKLNV